MVSAHVVPLNGAVLDPVIQLCARDFERLGPYGQVTLKSDQEEIVEFSRGNRESSWVPWNVVKAFAGCRLTVEWFFERGIRSVEEMRRVILLGVQSLFTRRCFRFRGLLNMVRTS